MKEKRLNDGLLIVFDGIDGTGKTTQLELARDELAAEGWALNTSRNLGGTPIGEELRQIIKSRLPRPETANLYISAAIQEALIREIESQRRQGNLILMDRGPLSLAAYEIYGGKLAADKVWQYVDEGMLRLKPELVIIYATNVATALGRTKHNGDNADYFEDKSSDYFERVAGGYIEAARRYPDSCVVIDANRPVNDVHGETMYAIRKVLTSHAHSAH